MTWIGHHRKAQEHEVVQLLAEVLVHVCQGVVKEQREEVVEVEVQVHEELVGEDVELDRQRSESLRLQAPQGWHQVEIEKRRDVEQREEPEEVVEELVEEGDLVQVDDVEEVRGAAQAPL